MNTQEEEQIDKEAGEVEEANKTTGATPEEIANGYAFVNLAKPLVVDGKEGITLKLTAPLARHRYSAIKKAGDNFTLQFMEIALMVSTLEVEGRSLPLTKAAYDSLSFFDTLKIEKKLLDLAGF